MLSVYVRSAANVHVAGVFRALLVRRAVVAQPRQARRCVWLFPSALQQRWCTRAPSCCVVAHDPEDGDRGAHPAPRVQGQGSGGGIRGGGITRAGYAESDADAGILLRRDRGRSP